MDSDNWVVQNLQNALDTWNTKMAEVWSLLTTSPQSFKGGGIWHVITQINGAVKAIGLALFDIAQGIMTTIMSASGVGSAGKTTLPTTMVSAIEDCGFFESIPLWAVTLIGSLFITVLSFIIILTVYGRFFKLYMYTAIAPIPLSTFAGQPTQNIGVSFLKSYGAVCLEGAIIVLACVIFSKFAVSPPVVDKDAAAATMVWKYVGELCFNMLVLVGAVRMSDRISREVFAL